MKQVIWIEMSYNQVILNQITFNNRFYLEIEEQVESEENINTHPRKDE